MNTLKGRAIIKLVKAYGDHYTPSDWFYFRPEDNTLYDMDCHILYVFRDPLTAKEECAEMITIVLARFDKKIQQKIDRWYLEYVKK